jgi:hypothetical protein
MPDDDGGAAPVVEETPIQRAMVGTRPTNEAVRRHLRAERAAGPRPQSP